MSMIDAIPLLAGAGGDYQISRSVRLRSSASAYFSRTNTNPPTNAKIGTLSMWLKRGSLATGNSQYLVETGTGTSNNTHFTLFFQTDNTLAAGQYSETPFTNTAVFRDPAAWYHLVITYDSTQATASNRFKLYINNQLFTSSTTITQNNEWAILQASQLINIGRHTSVGRHFDGYLTEINLIDGQALTPSSFGETNAVTGVWQPKKYTGTYGTNGFYLNFSDNSGVTATTIGKDYSGNGNNWTPSAGISVTAGVTYDSMLDVPTPYADGGNGRGNYAVMNPIVPATSFTPKGGNLDVSATGTFSSSGIGTASTIAVTGSYYFEITLTTNSNANAYFGVSSNENISNATGFTSTSWAFAPLGSGAGNKYTNSSGTAFAGGSYTANGAGVVFGVAVDATNGKFYVRDASGWINGTSVDATPTTAVYTGLPSILYPAIGMQSGTSQTVAASINFGQRPFTYTPPSGFVALNTQNLPTPTISNGATVMAATTYTGTSANQSISNAVNGVSFQPDFVWMKKRSAAESHILQNSISGVTKFLISNSTAVEDTSSAIIQSFDSGGFTAGTSSTINGASTTYIAWQWNAGGSTVTNTSGSISAQVRANPTAGFSVVTYTGTGANATVGHGLGVAPKMVIVKQRTGTAQQWAIWHTALLGTEYLGFDTAAKNALANVWNSTTPTSSVFSIGPNGSSGANTINYVAYCFSAVAGYSAFGSYTGNGVADGVFVYLGFRPRFIMIKSTSASTEWVMIDTSRSSYNLSETSLYANRDYSESTIGTVNDIDILSNGFKLRNNTGFVNASQTYIYAAFSEVDFKYALGR